MKKLSVLEAEYMAVIEKLLKPERDAPLDLVSLYIFRCGDHVKIGVSNNAASRALELQIGNPRPIQILFESTGMSRVDAMSLERRVHTDLAAVRSRGEWFECSADEAIAAVLRQDGASA